MDTDVRLVDLEGMHPQLLWEPMILALTSLLGDTPERRFRLPMELIDLPNEPTSAAELLVSCEDIDFTEIARLERTYEAARLVELGAISAAGLALHAFGGHEIVDVSLRGTSADYLVDASNDLLEIAGRSRSGDFQAAWAQKCERLEFASSRPYYIFVVEFETPNARLQYFH